MRKPGLTGLTGGKAIGAESTLLLAKDNNDVVKRDAERERILAAFFAETGLLPSECEQVTVHGTNGMRWYIRKRDQARDK
jgi:hypothetical protein